MADLICPHCRGTVPYGASVCRGCQAELHYGVTISEYFVVFLVCLILGEILGSFLPKSLVFIGSIAGIGGYIFLFIRLRKQSKTRVKFKRRYRT